jgi:hypothetical protein
MAPLLVFESHRACDQIKRLRTSVHPSDPASECSQLGKWVEGKHVSDWNAIAQVTIDVIRERKITC